MEKSRAQQSRFKTCPVATLSFRLPHRCCLPRSARGNRRSCCEGKNPAVRTTTERGNEHGSTRKQRTVSRVDMFLFCLSRPGKMSTAKHNAVLKVEDGRKQALFLVPLKLRSGRGISKVAVRTDSSDPCFGTRYLCCNTHTCRDVEVCVGYSIKVCLQEGRGDCRWYFRESTSIRFHRACCDLYTLTTPLFLLGHVDVYSACGDTRLWCKPDKDTVMRNKAVSCMTKRKIPRMTQDNTPR